MFRHVLPAVALSLAPCLALSQSPATAPAAALQGRVFRVAIVANSLPAAQWSATVLEDGTPHPGQTIREGLEKLGWVDGRNVQIVWRSAEGRYDRLSSIFAEVASLPVDVIVAIGPGVSIAIRATRVIPIVMVVSGGTLGSWVDSLSRPDRNLTGLSVETEGQEGKRLELLKTAVPKATRFALLVERGVCSMRPTTALEEAASKLGVTLVPVAFDSPDQMGSAFAEASAKRVEAVLVCDGVRVWRHGVQRAMNALALRHRLPIMHVAAGGADNGGLMAYGVDIMVQYRRVPYYVDRILRGAKPRDLPIEQPQALEFAVNLRTARELGITIPESILLQAHRAID